MTPQSTTPSSSRDFLFIFSLHRSGSTFLLSMFDKDNGQYEVIPEEVNLEEHVFFRNTVARKMRAGVQISFEKRALIHGSYWRNLEHYHENPQAVFESMNQLSTFSYRGVFEAITGTKAPDKRTLVVKYPCNVLFLRRLMAEMPQAHYCLLVRDLGCILKSKINDEQMRTLKEKSRLRYMIKRLSILAFFVFDYVHLSRSVERLKWRENVTIIHYDDIRQDRNCLKDIGLIGRDVDLYDNVHGKKSSMYGAISNLNIIEKALAYCIK